MLEIYRIWFKRYIIDVMMGMGISTAIASLFQKDVVQAGVFLIIGTIWFVSSILMSKLQEIKDAQ